MLLRSIPYDNEHGANMNLTNNTISKLLNALHLKHEPTHRHSILAASVALEIAPIIDSGERVPFTDVRDAALLHDVGKLNIPVCILDKSGSLSPREWDCIKLHPKYGEEILLATEDKRLHSLSRYVLEHHELHDGSGYPHKLGLKNIHIISRIINIADRFAALTEDRPYRKALLPAIAVDYLREDIETFFPMDGSRIISTLKGYEHQEYHVAEGYDEPAFAAVG
jgi:HD-GYP domain-containing protein (c-di-GMP phosphodiesterase class II)